MRPHFYPLAALCETGLFLLRKDENTRIQSSAENSLPSVTEAANDTGSQKHTDCSPYQDPLWPTPASAQSHQSVLQGEQIGGKQEKNVGLVCN